jgi:pyruvate kinase
MFARTTRTKLVWTVTEKYLREEGAARVADRIFNSGIQAVKAIYTESIVTGLQELRRELALRVLSAKTNPDANGLYPFLLSFVSRRALLDVGVEPFQFVEGKIEAFEITVDVDFCSLNLHRGTDTKVPRIAVTSPDMLQNIVDGSLVSFSFGECEGKVKNVRARSPECLEVSIECISGGVLRTGMQVSSPAMPHDLFPLLPQDKKALETRFGGLADYVIINGLRHESELNKIKEQFYDGDHSLSKRHPSVPIGPAVRECDAPVPPRFIIKIDSEHMLANFSTLLDQVDGTYLSRSELGTLVHPHSLPIAQKEIIAKCNAEAKIVMIASELMHSMHVNPNPTRAEVSDLANAVSDGADALVLEQDVTEGPYADEVAQVSQETVLKSEPGIDEIWNRVPFEIRNDDDAVAYGAIRTAEHVGAKALVCLTEGGYTAARLSSMRTPVDVIAVTYNTNIMRQLALMSAVYPVRISSATAFDRVLAETKSCLFEHCGLVRGDKFVFISLTSSSISERQSNFFTIQVLE